MKIFSFLSLYNPKLTLIMLVPFFAFGQGRVNVVDNKGTMSKTGVEIITSTSAPTVPTPIKGDLWVDNSNSSGFNKVFKVYDGTSWIEVNNSENIYIKDNTVDKDGDEINDTNVTLQQFVENTNNQDLNLSGNTLSISNDSSTVDLSPYLDNSDNQDVSTTLISTLLAINISADPDPLNNADIDLTPAVKIAETLTTISQDASTGVITYNDEVGGSSTLDVRKANFMPNGDNTYTLTDDYNVSRTDIPSTAYVDNLIGFNVDPDMNFPHPLDMDSNIYTIDAVDLISSRILASNLFYINFPGPDGNSTQISKLMIRVADLTPSDKGKIIKLVENENITNGNNSAPTSGSPSNWKKYKEILIYNDSGTTDILNGGILNPTNHIYYETIQLYWDGTKWLPFK